MERFTKIMEGSGAYLENMSDLMPALDRLAAYEDTNLTPEEVRRLLIISVPAVPAEVIIARLDDILADATALRAMLDNARKKISDEAMKLLAEAGFE